MHVVTLEQMDLTTDVKNSNYHTTGSLTFLSVTLQSVLTINRHSCEIHNFNEKAWDIYSYWGLSWPNSVSLKKKLLSTLAFVQFYSDTTLFSSWSMSFSNWVYLSAFSCRVLSIDRDLTTASLPLSSLRAASRLCLEQFTVKPTYTHTHNRSY